MPKYTYECSVCGEVIEVDMKVSELDTKKIKCPECNHVMCRIISKPEGFILKGKGFHRNDYPKGRNYHGS